MQVRKNKEQMARWECLDCGKPIVECEADMVRVGQGGACRGAAQPHPLTLQGRWSLPRR